MPLNIDYVGTDAEQTVNLTKLKAFLAMTPLEVGAYLESHIVDLASAKDMMVTMGMLLKFQADEILKLR